jgi:LysM repeat protein
MPLELIKNPLKVSRIIGENVFSTVVEEDINVPDINPDLYKILAPNATVQLKDCEVLNDKVVVNGQLLISILYSADDEGKPLSNMDVAANFSQSIEIPGARPKMKESINTVIQHIDCYMINSRKLGVKVIMDLCCRVEDLFDLELAADVRGLSDIQVLHEPSSFKQVVGNNKDRYEFNEELNIAADIPAIGKVLRSDFKVVVKDEKAIDGKVEVNGMLGIDILYNAEGEENQLQYQEFEVPFTQYIEVPAAEKGMECSTESNLQECDLEISEDANGEKRVINAFMVLGMGARVFKDTEQEIVVDAYSPSNVVDVEKNIFSITEFVGKGRSNVVVKETISIKHGDPEIEKVCCVNALPVVNEIKLLDDRVMLEGMIECTAVYVTSYSAEPMCSMTEQIPFRHFIDIPGVRLGMPCTVKCSADSVSFTQINNEVIEIRAVLGVYAEAVRHIEKRLVEKVEAVEGVSIDYGRIPAVTMYMVQRGDTLWSIAKRYNTTVDALARLNDIENPSRVAKGMQIMILKNIRVGQNADK